MSTKRSIILKIVSVLTVFFIHLPSQKFSIPYGMGVLFTLTERISELQFTSDFFINSMFIFGLLILFSKKKWLILGGYILLITPLLFYIANVSKYNFGIFFWIPLALFLVISTIVVFQNFKTHKI